MRGLSKESSQDALNPYIALADTTLNLVLVLVLFVASVLLAIQLRENTYKDARVEFQQAVEQAITPQERPRLIPYMVKNDPPGSQRWSFSQFTLFESGTARFTPKGNSVLERFAQVLAQYGNTYRRVRIEGHTLPTPAGGRDNWALATDRAAAVANLFTSQACALSPYYLATAGRGGQDPLGSLPLTDRRHERIEIVLEYAAQSARAQNC